jgi:hypothetical protein
VRLTSLPGGSLSMAAEAAFNPHLSSIGSACHYRAVVAPAWKKLRRESEETFYTPHHSDGD